MKTRLFLVRHGETEWNKLGKFQGTIDIDLSEQGIAQAHCVSKRFNGNFDHIYSSPLKRAYETAEIICEGKGIKPLLANDLREISFGEWEGMTIKDILDVYPSEFDRWINDEVEAPLCGGDLSLRKASIRAKNAIREIVNKHKGDSIIVVAHGGIIKAALVGIFSWNMTMYHKMVIGNTSVTEIDFDDNLSPVIVKLNDTSHISNK